MQIIHLIRYEDPIVVLRHQAIDAAVLSEHHDVDTWVLRGDGIDRSSGDGAAPLSSAVTATGQSLLHIYTSDLPPSAVLRSISGPWIAPISPKGDWFGMRSGPVPDRIRSVHPSTGGEDPFPEAVELPYFEISGTQKPAEPSVGGIVDDEPSRSLFDAVRARITRTRDDVRWRPFSGRPSPEEMATVDVWVDFGTEKRAADNCVPEALVAGRTVVAPRTGLNTERLLDGDAGFLVPVADPNEMAHVVVTALFKPEVAAPRREAALATRQWFDPSHRGRLIEELYRELQPA